MPFLYIVATPIGNLEDISLRALRVLGEVDFILAEDTRVSAKLLNHYSIATPTISYHQHSNEKKISHILSLLEKGHDLALVTDAGTPGISDPGGRLIASILTDKLSDKVQIVPIPGPSAVAAIASISDKNMDKFLFLGFPPHKKGRNKFFEEVLVSKHPVILYESSHRIIKTLQQLLALALTKNNNYDIVVARELTKRFETIYRGSIDKVLNDIQQDKLKGEFTLIISKIKSSDSVLQG